MAITMGKGELKAYLCNAINGMDSESIEYEQFCDIFLTMCGAIDADGNLTEEYACSPYWQGGTDGVPIRPSVQAGLMSKLSPDMRDNVIKMELDNAE